MPTDIDEHDWNSGEWDENLDLPNDDFDNEDTPTVPCPKCHQPIPDFVDRCPYCGDWVVPGSTTGGHSTWVIVAAILALAGFLLVYAI